MEWYLKVINSYFDFNGSPEEYWMFVLINSIISVLYSFGQYAWYSLVNWVWPYIYWVWLASVPGLAVAIRRLHDIGKSVGIIFL